MFRVGIRVRDRGGVRGRVGAREKVRVGVRGGGMRYGILRNTLLARGYGDLSH